MTASCFLSHREPGNYWAITVECWEMPSTRRTTLLWLSMERLWNTLCRSVSDSTSWTWLSHVKLSFAAGQIYFSYRNKITKVNLKDKIRKKNVDKIFLAHKSNINPCNRRSSMDVIDLKITLWRKTPDFFRPNKKNKIKMWRHSGSGFIFDIFFRIPAKTLIFHNRT